MIEFWQEFLANQYEYSKRYKGFGKYDRELFNFISDFNNISSYNSLNPIVPDAVPLAVMASNPITVSFLRFLIQITRAHQVLEIGTYIGISAIKMAQVMPSSGYLITIEKGKQFAELARANIKANKPACEITVAWGDALELVNDWQLNPYNLEDLIFLDGDKEHYNQYLDPLIKLLRPGGLLVVDDVLFHGDVLNEEPTTPQGNSVRKLLEKAAMLAWPKSLLPLGNGLLLLQRPS